MSKTKPQPKKLTLKQAIDVTRKPLKRWGDLIIVQVHKELRNNPDFPAGEVRSTFMPSLPDRDGNFERNFPQPDTESYLRELDDRGGWVESIAEFSDEALALHYNYRGGIFRGNAFAGDVGDPSHFERDFKESLEALPNVTPEIAAAVRKSIVNQHKKYKLPANEGEKYLARQSDSSKRLRESAQKHTEQDHAKWETEARQLKNTNPALSVNAISQKLSESLAVPKPTIKKYLLENCTDLRSKVLDS